MTSAHRKRCEDAAARLMVEDNMDPKRLVNGPDWWWEDHAKSTIADAIERMSKDFAERVAEELKWGGSSVREAITAAEEQEDP